MAFFGLDKDYSSKTEMKQWDTTYWSLCSGLGIADSAADCKQALKYHLLLDWFGFCSFDNVKIGNIFICSVESKSTLHFPNKVGVFSLLIWVTFLTKKSTIRAAQQLYFAHATFYFYFRQVQIWFNLVRKDQLINDKSAVFSGIRTRIVRVEGEHHHGPSTILIVWWKELITVGEYYCSLF